MKIIFKWSEFKGLINQDNSYHKKPTENELNKLQKEGVINTDNKIMFYTGNLIEVRNTINNGIVLNIYKDFYEVI